MIEKHEPFRLYRVPRRGEYCVVGVDTSEGGDMSAAVFKSAVYFDSFMVLSGHFNSAEFGPILERGAYFISKITGTDPLIAVERNKGTAIINYLINQGYSNLYKQEVFDEVMQKYIYKIGWQTSTQSRKKMLDEQSMDYNEAMENGEARVYDLLTVRQLLTFIRNKRTGKPEAESQCFDDLVIAESIATQVAITAPVEKVAQVVRTPQPATESQRKLRQPSAEWRNVYDLEKLKKQGNRPRNWKSI